MKVVVFWMNVFWTETKNFSYLDDLINSLWCFSARIDGIPSSSNEICIIKYSVRRLDAAWVRLDVIEFMHEFLRAHTSLISIR